MNTSRHIFTILSICIIFVSTALAQHTIIPAPASYAANNEVFLLNSNVSIVSQSDSKLVKKYINRFKQYLQSLNIKSKPKKEARKIQIEISSLPSSYIQPIGDEGYTLDISYQKITIWANRPAGIFYALETLKQLIPTSSSAGEVSIPGCVIVDFPRFRWRGLMLDVSRHFFSAKDVKAYIDKMASYKFNVFHWHLSDDQGWRIEIKSLPKLTEIGAWRAQTYGRFGGPEPDPKEKPTYGGFYTQDQIRDIVQYAAERNITIVPEVDMPGHCMAVLAAYPELSTKKEPKKVNPGSKFVDWYGNGKFKMNIENTLNPADEKTYEFADKVFTELADLFPGQYIHMGGDECYHGYWKEDIGVQEFMKKNRLKTTHELQTYFVNRLEKIIHSKGKKLIGWDEILSDNLSTEAAVMSWRGMKEGFKAAAQKHKVVMSPTTFAYLDYVQGDESLENHVYASLSLKKTYQFNPDSTNNPYIMGGQANLWTENIPTLPFAFYMTYPRAFAISESLWSPNYIKNWNSFMQRTEYHFDRFDASNTNISKAVYEPIAHVYFSHDTLMCALNNNVPDTEIYYTIDNTYPPKFGTKYSTPFAIPKGNLQLRTQSYRGGLPIGREIIIDRKELAKRAQ